MDLTWSVALVQTKMAPPRLPPGIVRRTALLERLGEPCDRELAVVIAPAGSGKTTLLAEWSEVLCAREHLVAWLSLDEDDDDPQQFAAYLVAALGRTSEDIGQQAQQLLRDDLMAPGKTIVSVLLNEIASCGRQVFLVLDDFDRSPSRLIRAMVSRLLRYAPQNFHLLLGVRSEPELALGQLPTQGKLLRIDAADLRFSVDDAQTFFRQAGGVSLDRSSVELLNEATEGWVAGLQLASLALRDTADAAQVAHTLSGTRLGIDRYLDDTVLVRLPAPILKFLLHTSILDRLGAGVCDAVMGEGARSWEKLDWLERHNVFTRPLDEERQWYRYHSLLSDALRRRIARQCAAQLPTLHRRASRWFAEARLWPEAIRHALAAGEMELAARWIENCATAMVNRSDVLTLSGWIAKLPPALVQERLRLRLTKAWALALSLQTAEAAREVKALAAQIAQFRADGTLTDAALPAEVNAVSAIIAGLNDDSSRSLVLAKEAATYPLPNLPWVSRFAETAQIFGLLSEGNFDEVRRIQASTPACGDANQVPLYADVYRESMFGLAELVQGRLQDAVRTLEAALARAESALGCDSAAAALPAGYLASIYYERDDLARAQKMVSGRTAIAMETCPLGSLLRYTCSAARLYARGGDVGSAHAVLEDARQVAAARQWLRLRVGCDAEAVRFYLSQGRLVQARQTAETLRLAMPPACSPLTGSFIEIWASYSMMRARLLLAQGHAGDAVTLLETLRDEMATSGRWYLDALVSILLTLALEQQGERARAFATLEHALGIAQPTGMINGLVDEGAPLRALLERWRGTAANVASFDPTYLDRLFSAFDTNHRSEDDTPRVPSAVLSAREIEILDHIARGLSNKEIGRALRVAPETVKWHLKNIFEKLNVSSRVEAAQSGLGLSRASRTETSARASL
ncbi:LuxR C-terminal-related transcriptional regulator [Paraburkholderia phytofirmans]|uniref:LuxR C-terminal-related transcriptional regulator n=1 Tax=Paraburkholderia phytofirmans TaxID=261302 RepID=UPI001EEE9A5A|nr:LuxR C-terminal-related transcriptional regulator [Paraburkholderia phytofirmans]